jgi:putative addiction module antidote
MNNLKLIAIGTSTGVVIPKEMLARLKVAKGDTLYATETADGGYHLTAFNPDRVTTMAKAEEILNRYRTTLNVLAK